MFDELNTENSEIYEYSEDDQIVEATKIQMVLGTLEKSLVDLIFKDIHNFDRKSGAAGKAYKSFVNTYRREPKDDQELIRKSNLSQLPAIAKQCLIDSSQHKYLERIDQLINALQIYKSRNHSFAHPGNHYHPVHWARVQALALDPVIKNLGFFNVVERYYAAKKGNLERTDIMQDDWNEIPNNLPNPDFDEIIGRDKLAKEIKEYLLNPRKPSISIFGAGGTGKTALTLSVLNEIKFCENNAGDFDFILFSSLKDEFLEEGLLRKEVLDLTINGIKNQFLHGFLSTLEHYNSNIFNEDFKNDYSKNVDQNWNEFCREYGKYRFLLWVDNLETLSNDIYEVFAKFESSLPREWKIIVTSRIRIRESSSIISLGPLEKNSAANLFQRIYKDKLGKKIEFNDALNFSQKLFCNPLAIKNAIGYQKKNNASLIEAVQCGAESIITFSYTKLVTSLSQKTKDILEVLFVFGEQRKLDINKKIDIDIDDVSESISEVEDLGLGSRGISSADCIKLNDNFRSYLSIYPLNDNLRSELILFKEEKLNPNILSIANKENNPWSSQMKFSYLRPETRIDDTFRIICTEAISALGRFYRVKENQLSDQETKNNALDDLRKALKQLEEIEESNNSSDVPPAVYRLIGLIYAEFNDQSLMNKYLLMAADLNDPNALLTLFYKFNGLKDPRANEFGFRFYESLDNPKPDSIPYIKYITSFTRSLIYQNKFDDVIKLTNDYDSRNHQNQLLFVLIRAEAYITNAKHQLANIDNKNITQEYADEIGELLLKSYECYEVSQYSLSTYSTKRLLGLYSWVNTFMQFTKRARLSSAKKLKYKGSLLKLLIPFKEDLFDQIYNERFNWIETKYEGSKKSDHILRLEILKEYLEDLCNYLKNLEFKQYNFIEVEKFRWFAEHNKEVKFSHFAGFDKKYAIFEDENNNQFITKATVYNLFATKRESTKNKIPKFYKLSSNSKINVRVYRYYLNHKIYNKRNEIIEIL